jgi:hypothetical protein
MALVKKQEAFQVCGICHRSLLLGERSMRYTPGRDEWIDVCALCTETASDRGWIREGSRTSPILEYSDRRRRRFGLATLGGLLADPRRSESEPHVPEPVLRRLSEKEQAMVEAAELFNASPYRRTLSGIQKSLGAGQVSLLPLSGVNSEVVLTVVWEISWYQYRVALDGVRAVKLVDRGYELDELDERFRDWNGYLEPDGKVMPDMPRL